MKGIPVSSLQPEGRSRCNEPRRVCQKPYARALQSTEGKSPTRRDRPHGLDSDLSIKLAVGQRHSTTLLIFHGSDSENSVSVWRCFDDSDSQSVVLPVATVRCPPTSTKRSHDLPVCSHRWYEFQICSFGSASSSKFRSV
jgi:hypothetical protein